MIIYKKTSKGAIQQWSQEIEGSKYRTVSGQVTGKLVISVWKQCIGTNIGRANERTPDQQALFEVAANYKKKLDRDYHESIDDIENGSHIFECMLAWGYEDALLRKNPPDHSTIYAQPKLNGFRCIINKDGMWTRKGKKIVSAPHIFNSLKSYFEKNPSKVFDGELYNHEFFDDFNELSSIFKTLKPTEEDLIKSEKYAQYHVYDFPVCGDHVKFEFRLVHLEMAVKEANSPYLHFVRTDKVISKEHLDKLYIQYLEQGYEGQIVRENSWYKNKRTWALLKRKQFLDAEFECVDIIEGIGNWSKKAKRAILKLPDGRIFGAGITGTMEYCANLLVNKDKYIGKPTTVNFFSYTPDGIPLFGRCKEFDRIDK